MQRASAIKVGVAMVAGLGLLAVLLWTLSHWELGKYRLYAAFDDTKGLMRDTPVRMNGVPVGEVSAIRLRASDLKPVVVLAVRDRFRVPANARIRITSGILIANPQIDIYWTGPPASRSMRPGSDWPAGLVDTQPVSALAQLSPQAEAALRGLSQTMAALGPKLNKALDQTQAVLKHTNATMANFEATSATLRETVQDLRLRKSMRTMLTNFEAVSSDAKQLSQTMRVQLQGLVKRNGPKIDELVDSAVELLQNFSDTVDAARGIMTQLTEQISDPRLQQSLVDTLDLAKTTMARFSQIASDIHGITGDAEVQSNLRTTISSLKETTQEGQKIAQKFAAIAERIKIPSGGPRFGIGQPQLAIDFLWRGKRPHFRSDVNVRFPFKSGSAFDLGLYDLAGNNRLNAQYESPLSRDLSLRYGLYAAELGVGLDWQALPSVGFRFDGYNPNDARLDARALIKINNSFSAWLGVDSLFRHGTPLIGVELNR